VRKVRRFRLRAPALTAGLTICVTLFATSAPKHAAGAQSPEETVAPSFERARAFFADLTRATAELDVIGATPGSQIARARAWEARWRGRLTEVDRFAVSVCAVDLASCDSRAAYALICDATRSLRVYATGLRRPLSARGASPSLELARRAAVAEEAMRRQSLALSCTDLPGHAALRARPSPDAPWMTTDNRPLRAEPTRTAEGSSSRLVLDNPYADESEIVQVPVALPRASARTRAVTELIGESPYPNEREGSAPQQSAPREAPVPARGPAPLDLENPYP
jgi:hypothetical protein